MSSVCRGPRPRRTRPEMIAAFFTPCCTDDDGGGGDGEEQFVTDTETGARERERERSRNTIAKDVVVVTLV